MSGNQPDEQLTAYDVVYVALAEVLDGVLLTCDRRLSQGAGDDSPSRACRVWTLEGVAWRVPTGLAQ